VDELKTDFGIELFGEAEGGVVVVAMPVILLWRQAG